MKVRTYIFVPCSYVRYDLCKNDVRFVFTLICFVGNSCSINTIHIFFTNTGVQHDFHVFRWCSCRLIVTRRCEAEITNPSGAPAITPGFSGVRVVQSSVFCVVLVFLSLCPFFFWPLHCRITAAGYPFGIFKLDFMI